MAITASHPHWNTNVIDNSIYTPLVEEVLPLHLPVYPMKCQSGPVGKAVWCKDYLTAKTVFGAETFNSSNKMYYSKMTRFALTTFPYHGCWIVRLAEGAYKSAGVVLEALVEEKQIPTWERDVEGNVILDEFGNLQAVPETTESGIEIIWRTRSITPAELEAGIENIASTSGDGSYVYPIMVHMDQYPGVNGNDRCFSLYRDFANIDTLLVTNLGSQVYTMAPKKKQYGNTSVENVLDENGNVSNQFSFIPDAVDPTTDTAMSFSDQFPKRYENLPVDFAIYNQNIKAIGDLFLTTKGNSYTDNGVVVDDNGMLVDIFTGKDFANQPYTGMRVLNAETALVGDSIVGISFSSANLIYATGGADGALDDISMEESFIKFTNGTMFPEVVDKLRYPMTHIYDPGFSIDTKKACLEFMALRDDVVVTVCTQDLSNHGVDGEITPVYETGNPNPINGLTPSINSEYQDESAAISLRAYGLLFPESLDKGTGACRFSIGMQAGVMASNEVMPCSLRIAEMRGERMNTSSLKAGFGGRPNSECYLFDTVSYTPSSEGEKSRLWAAGGNYLSYFDRTGLFYAALRTGYNYETSVLSDLYFVDVVTYTKHAIGRSWTLFTGVTIPFNVLQQNITTDLTGKLSTIYNGKYIFDVQVYQTVEEANRGYETHVAVNIESPASNRVWNVDINCNREGYTAS